MQPTWGLQQDLSGDHLLMGQPRHTRVTLQSGETTFLPQWEGWLRPDSSAPQLESGSHPVPAAYRRELGQGLMSEKMKGGEEAPNPALGPPPPTVRA